MSSGRRGGLRRREPVTVRETRDSTRKENPKRLVICEFMSLDGVVQAPGGPDEDTEGGFAHGGWTHPSFDPEVVGGAWDAALEKADALLYGRRTWKGMAGAWPDRAGDPPPQAGGPPADRMNSIRTYVVSATLTDSGPAWENTTRIPGEDAVARIRELRETSGGDLLVMGSPTLARTLLHEGLAEELVLIVMPVVLGGGKDDLPRRRRQHTLELVSTTTSGAGVNVCVYRVAEKD